MVFFKTRPNSSSLVYIPKHFWITTI